jgi:serine/threonine protein phosphatase 1
MTPVPRKFPGPSVIRVPRNPNPRGRDFVVADLHGQYSALMRELARVGFDEQFDRLFCVGDLFDGGTENLECLRLLDKTWFFTVLGNHEAMMLTMVANRYSAVHCVADCEANGGDWIYELSSPEKDELSGYLARLQYAPLVLVVDHEAGNFNVTHAQLMLGAKSGILTNRSLQENACLDDWEHGLTWGRSLFKMGAQQLHQKHLFIDGESLICSKNPVEPGLGLTYVGHSVTKCCFLHRSHLFFDHGAKTMPENGRLVVLEHAAVMCRLKRLGLSFAN